MLLRDEKGNAMALQDNVLYTTEHEWVRIADKQATIGITTYAQDQLGEIVYVDLPEVGEFYSMGESFGEVESVKSVSELLMPLAGSISAINEELEETPDLVNTDSFGQGWIAVIDLSEEVVMDDLMDEGAYADFCDGV